MFARRLGLQLQELLPIMTLPPPPGARVVNARSTIPRPISTDVITDSG